MRPANHVEWANKFGGRSCELMVQCSSTANLVWANIWKLKVPSKVKILILVNLHIGTSGQCTMCTLDDEDSRHCFFGVR
jgi:hypothetical protein